MAKDLVALIDTEEVEHIFDFYFEDDEDKEEKVTYLMDRVEDGTINHYIGETFDSWFWQQYWEQVEAAVMDWADYALNDKE